MNREREPQEVIGRVTGLGVHGLFHSIITNKPVSWEHQESLCKWEDRNIRRSNMCSVSLTSLFICLLGPEPQSCSNWTLKGKSSGLFNTQYSQVHEKKEIYNEKMMLYWEVMFCLWLWLIFQGFVQSRKHGRYSVLGAEFQTWWTHSLTGQSQAVEDDAVDQALPGMNASFF